MSDLIVSANNILRAFPTSNNYQYVIKQIRELSVKWNTYYSFSRILPGQITLYLFCEFTDSPAFTVSEQSKKLEKEFVVRLKNQKLWESFNADLSKPGIIIYRLIRRFEKIQKICWRNSLYLIVERTQMQTANYVGFEKTLKSLLSNEEQFHK